MPIQVGINFKHKFMKSESAATDTGAVLELLFRFGRAYLACGEQTAKVERTLHRMASAYGMHSSRVVVFPTAVFIALHDGAEERITLAEAPIQSLRLDQIADVYELGDAVEEASMGPREAVDRLAAILEKKPRFGPAGVVAGHTILTVGLAMVLRSTSTDLVAAVVLGAIVGAVKVLSRRRAVLTLQLPVVAAALVSAIVFLAVKWGVPLDPMHTLVPPLVTFLPGGMLSLGMVELAFGDMVSGSTRLVTGSVQLVLLAFGLAAGAALVGVGYEQMLDSHTVLATAPWMPWLGVVVFGVGVYLHFSAPRDSLLWMLLVLLLAFAAQQLAVIRFGSEISGFFGMLVATPVSYLIQRRFKRPPAMVTFLPSFWLLVPGSLGLLSVTRMLNDRSAGANGLISAVFAFASIALGTLMGASLYKWLTEKTN